MCSLVLTQANLVHYQSLTQVHLHFKYHLYSYCLLPRNQPTNQRNVFRKLYNPAKSETLLISTTALLCSSWFEAQTFHFRKHTGKIIAFIPSSLRKYSHI